MPVYTDFYQWAKNIKGAILPEEEPSVYPTNVFITPIAKGYKKNKPCSRKDWEEQEERARRGEQVMWDGPALNRTQPVAGDLMAVWFHKDHVNIYEVSRVLKPSSRLPTWSKNIGQSDRQVVYLDNPLRVEWDKWLSLGGFKRCMGTGTINSSKYGIIEHWISNK